ncbi:Nudix family hydrolase [Aestuariirhabdus litorea]|uniref:8-oxo-dGTP diphosphatase n=1 Tax=Aestuariirhabdus litorea TaxID=2528527 RepID=A0A3P3VRZ2_9GAMM|nr:Nudix family hydrolase [Aestuariirhabdus litorea]RWW98735.1 Nudix family hydrolase [Endozoicomonadaceae bacterium GTF-13]
MVVGVLVNGAGELLISRRDQAAHLGGFWEFPGGKVDAGETPLQALARELDEELGVTPLHMRPLISLQHSYPDRHIQLEAFCIERFKGIPRGREGQPLRWVRPEQLKDYPFPEANRALNLALTLPPGYLITGPFASRTQLLERLERALERGLRLVQWRAPWLDPHDYHALIAPLAERCARAGARLLLKGEPSLLAHYPQCGLHLSAAQLSDEAVALWAQGRDRQQLLGASCHDAAELERAATLGVDFVTLSPVKPTRSHPGQAGLGWSASGALAEQATMPVYLLGGMAGADLERARALGGQGIAAISAFWG